MGERVTVEVVLRVLPSGRSSAMTTDDHEDGMLWSDDFADDAVHRDVTIEVTLQTPDEPLDEVVTVTVPDVTPEPVEPATVAISSG